MAAHRNPSFHLRQGLLLLLLTAAAFLLHGYHPYIEDAAFYLPPVEKALEPGLFSGSQQFFEAHAGLTLFPQLVAGCVRLTRLPLEIVLLLLHGLCLYLFLAGCWQVSCLCFELPEARWCAVGSVAALLTLPAGATTLLLFDQYLNPRAFSSCAGIFAVKFALERRYVPAVLLLGLAALVHPLMPVYSAFFLFLLWLGQKRAGVAAMAALLPLGDFLDPPTPAYHRAAMLHRWHYVQYWTWYEWVGVFAPIALLLWFGSIARARRLFIVELTCKSLVALLLCSLAGTLVLDLPPRFEALARLQPMRSLHLVYILLFLLLGGMLGQFVLRRAAWRWLLLFVPVCAGTLWVQLAMYPADAHVEWPGVSSRNPWVRAFVWVRENTPPRAQFAIDPDYLDLPGEDGQAFRPIAQRSMLADRLKDSGTVSMFPALAERWWSQVEALQGWKGFREADFRRLKERYGVNWVVLQQPGAPGLDCPYQNPSVTVCRLM